MENTPMNGNAKRLESVDLQLSICHALLAVAYHERNAAEAALTAAEAEHRAHLVAHLGNTLLLSQAQRKLK